MSGVDDWIIHTQLLTTDGALSTGPSSGEGTSMSMSMSEESLGSVGVELIGACLEAVEVRLTELAGWFEATVMASWMPDDPATL